MEAAEEAFSSRLPDEASVDVSANEPKEEKEEGTTRMNALEFFDPSLQPLEFFDKYLKLEVVDGWRYKALCLFCAQNPIEVSAERLPTLYISRKNGNWHCFDCGLGGLFAEFVRLVDQRKIAERKR